jgi:hypothetical protein
METTKKQRLVKKLRNKHPDELKMVLGFDGFIDEIIHVVDKRRDFEHFTRIDTIADFAKRIEKASGLSTNIELYPAHKKIGGNGPIMCNALAQHNADITYIGALGSPTIDDMFTTMPVNVDLISIANFGHTDALEFDDGKLLFGKMASLNDVTYERLLKRIPEDKLVAFLDHADLFASVNWSMLPNLTDIWEKMIEHIIPQLDSPEEKPIFFVDLADPEKREDDEIKRALKVLKGFKPAFRFVLGLNKKEAFDIHALIHGDDAERTLESVAKDLSEYVEADAVVIHPVDCSGVYADGVYYEEKGPYVKKPKLTTGAGDNFNAGFVLGLLLGLDPDEALLVGMGTSGYYVRQAKSPTFAELISFIDAWDKGDI